MEKEVSLFYFCSHILLLSHLLLFTATHLNSIIDAVQTVLDYESPPYLWSHIVSLLLVACMWIETKRPADVSAVYVGSVSQSASRWEYVWVKHPEQSSYQQGEFQ